LSSHPQFLFPPDAVPFSAVEAELEAAENEFRSPYFAAGPRTPEEQCNEDRMDILTGGVDFPLI
jgi:hypothetical protein